MMNIPDSFQKLDMDSRRQIRELNLRTWLTVSDASIFGGRWPKGQSELAEAAGNFMWKEVIELLHTLEGSCVNQWALDPKNWNTALHWAAEDGAPLEVVEGILASGAWRTLPNKAGERPIDIAVRRRHEHLLNLLIPPIRHLVTRARLEALEKSFNQHILGGPPDEWMGSGFSEEEREDQRLDYEKRKSLRSPVLAVLTELQEPKMFYQVPYGSYTYWLEDRNEGVSLIYESVCRVVEPSKNRFEITLNGRTKLPIEAVS